MQNLYDTDFYAWTHEQYEFIKNNKFDKLDIDNLLDEVEGMAKNVHNELYSRLKVLLMHLLKFKYQPNLRSRSWKLTIKTQRLELKILIKKNPSLKHELNEIIIDAYQSAILKAANETGLDEDIFPQECEWTVDQILNNANMDEIIIDKVKK